MQLLPGHAESSANASEQARSLPAPHANQPTQVQPLGGTQTTLQNPWVFLSLLSLLISSHLISFLAVLFWIFVASSQFTLQCYHPDEASVRGAGGTWGCDCEPVSWMSLQINFCSHTDGLTTKTST